MKTTGIAGEDLLQSMLDGSLPEKLEQLDPEVGEATGRAMAALHAEGRTDAMSFLLELEWFTMPFRRKWILRHALEAFAGHVEDNSQKVLAFFQAARHLDGSGSNHALDQAFEAWCDTHRSAVPDFVRSIKDKDVESAYLHAMLIRLWRDAPEDAIEFAVSFSRNPRDDMRSQAIFALGGFDYRNAADAEPAIVRLLELLPTSDPSDARAAILASCSLVRKPFGVDMRIVDALRSDGIAGDVERRRLLISGLLGRGGEVPTELADATTHLVRRLSLLDQFDVGLINRWLYEADLHRDRGIVLDVLSDVAANSADQWSFRALHGFTHRVSAATPSNLGWYVVKWLLEGTHQIRENLHELFSPLDQSIHGFDLSDLGLTKAEVPFLARKVFVHLMFSHGPAVSMLCALLTQLKGKKRMDLETEISDFWLRNFPNDIELFDAFERLHARSGLKASIGRLRSALNTYRAPIKDMSANPALRPSTMERRVQMEIAHERSRQVMRRADENSIFAQLVHKSVLLYGRSSVSYVQAGDGDPVRQVLPFQHIEHSVAIPTMDVLAPTRLLMLLQRFRNEPRPR